MPKHISLDTKKKIVSRYKEHPMTISCLADEYKISNPSVIKILDEFKIKRYSKVKLFSPDLDEHYFSSIDDEYKAYFLGLIITDGCVHNSKGKQPIVTLTLQEKDEYLLEIFKKHIRSNKNITHDGRGCSELHISSSMIVNDLKKYGVIPNKSLCTVFPKNLPDNMYPHLIRGILDGDGSVSYYSRPNRKSHVKAIRFCQGNEQFLIDIVDFLQSSCNAVKVNTYQEKESLWSIAYRKDISMVRIIDYIYKDAHVYMRRKKELCDLVYAEAYKYVNTEITNERKNLLAS